MTYETGERGENWERIGMGDYLIQRTSIHGLGTIILKDRQRGERGRERERERERKIADYILDVEKGYRGGEALRWENRKRGSIPASFYAPRKIDKVMFTNKCV